MTTQISTFCAPIAGGKSAATKEAIIQTLRTRDNPPYDTSPDYLDLNVQRRILKDLTFNEWSRFAWAVRDATGCSLGSVQKILSMKPEVQARCLADAIVPYPLANGQASGSTSSEIENGTEYKWQPKRFTI